MASKSTETCRDCKQFRMFCMCSASGGRVIGGSKKKKRAGGHHNSRLATGATLETLAIYAATMKRKAEKSPVHSALKAEIFTKYRYNSRKLAKASVITFYSATKSGRLQFSEIVGHWIFDLAWANIFSKIWIQILDFAQYFTILTHCAPPIVEPLYSRGCSRSSEVASGVADLANTTTEKIEMEPKEISDIGDCNTSHNAIEKLDPFPCLNTVMHASKYDMPR